MNFVKRLRAEYKTLPPPDPLAGIVHLDNVAEYVYSIPTEEFGYFEDSFCLVPPFPTTWFVFNLPKYANSNGTIIPMPSGTCAILTEYKEIESGLPTSLLGNIKYAVKIHWFFELFGESFGFRYIKPTLFGHYVIFCNHEGVPVRIPVKEDLVVAPGVLNAEVFPKLEGLKRGVFECDLGYHCVLIVALNFFHCKNVELQPIQTKKERRRKAHKYFERHYTILIKPITTRLETEGNVRSQGLKQALHICRGHFKEYKAKGLFGKYFGRYFWPAHTKGSLEIGKITKDYNLEGKDWRLK